MRRSLIHNGSCAQCERRAVYGVREKSILFVGAGVEQVPGILKARQLGLRVFAIDANPKARGAKFAHEFFNVSTHDVEAAADVAEWIKKKRGLDGVATIGVDAPITLATISDRLGLFGPSLETATLCSNKLIQKQALKRFGLPIPEFSAVSSESEVAKMLSRFKALVLKPIDSRGSRGVVQLYEGDNITQALNIARSHSPSGTVIAERMIRGPQISTESIIIDGKPYTVGFSDRNYEYWNRFKPHIIENGGDMPSRFLNLYDRINDLVAESARALGVRYGILKGDLVIENGEPKIIEFAARPSGGFFCTHQIPYSWGRDLVRVIILMYLGIPLKLEPVKPNEFCGSSIRFVHPETGTITAIHGIRDAYL
ncbi:MAG TPA: ATP-grasp domain-containing protein, partial [Proteobacteria bacterium]|nr:ATP-grasp domain-containing protein [Pseudomonadota bacterium]